MSLHSAMSSKKYLATLSVLPFLFLGTVCQMQVNTPQKPFSYHLTIKLIGQIKNKDAFKNDSKAGPFMSIRINDTWSSNDSIYIMKDEFVIYKTIPVQWNLINAINPGVFNDLLFIDTKFELSNYVPQTPLHQKLEHRFQLGLHKEVYQNWTKSYFNIDIFIRFKSSDMFQANQIRDPKVNNITSHPPKSMKFPDLKPESYCNKSYCSGHGLCIENYDGTQSCACDTGYAGVTCEVSECDVEFDDILASMGGGNFNEILANGTKIAANEETLKDFLKKDYHMNVDACNMTAVFKVTFKI
ncbi:hypothetical protein RF11_09291 [Thelohanellus kitauei]|uniref:EGF-like domain-containing protein n=1 Tax=Thelohanellus kitauei TaxID=669202 RepID=A0A0C2MCM6_THEKT|nr:hypothetical protein RF11_09291 [Thelohanellus kitauei]